MQPDAVQFTQRFRAALEVADLESPTLLKFPIGACTHASRFLSQFLADNGCGDWELVGAIKPVQSGYSISHAWLQRENVRLDITADQFDPQLPSVWLTPLKHPWYSEWREVSARISRMEHYAAHDLTYLADYRRLQLLAVQ